jgi:hypothetical protein
MNLWLVFVSQPYFWKSGRMTFTLPKWGLGSLLGLSKFQSSISRVKTPRIEALFISLESYQSVDVENGLAWTIWTSSAQVMTKKKRPRIELTIWLPTTKSQESTQPRCVQVECDTPLEISQQGLQLCFRPHCDMRSAQEVMCPQGHESPGTKNHFDVAPMESYKLYYMGEGGDFPWVWVVASLMNPESPVDCPSIKGVLESELTNLLVGWMQIRVSNWKACHFS